jgi:hypothetical protein
MPDDETLAKAVLAAYESLTSPDIERRMADDAAQRMPRHLADQIGAGIRDLGKLPAWLLIGFIQAFVDWDSDKSRLCGHRPRLDGPSGPVHFAAWSPGLVVCAECTDLLGAAQRCDCCGRPDDGALVKDNIIMGPVRYNFTVCEDCHPSSPH